jgi:hypothetical protein
MAGIARNRNFHPHRKSAIAAPQIRRDLPIVHAVARNRGGKRLAESLVQAESVSERAHFPCVA